jgi:hypothetical protein
MRSSFSSSMVYQRECHVTSLVIKSQLEGGLMLKLLSSKSTQCAVLWLPMSDRTSISDSSDDPSSSVVIARQGKYLLPVNFVRGARMGLHTAACGSAGPNQGVRSVALLHAVCLGLGTSNRLAVPSILNCSCGPNKLTVRSGLVTSLAPSSPASASG